MRWFKQIMKWRYGSIFATLMLANTAYGQVFFEAECGVSGNVWTAEFDAAASEQVHIQNTVDRDFNGPNLTGAQPLPDLMQYTVVVPTAGTYDLYFLEAHSGFNSLNYSIDNNLWTKFDLPTTGGAFDWVDAEATVVTGTYQEIVTTTANESVTIFISYGEPDLQIDKFALIEEVSLDVNAAVPSGQGTAVGSCFDFGDAPDTILNINTSGDYTTLLGNTVPGPIHSVDIAPAVFISDTAPDSEPEALESANASGDGSDEVNSIPSMIVSDVSYSLTLDVTNNKIFAATLMGWIDFNDNGLFEESERADTNQTVGPSAGATTRTLTWSGLSGLSAGNLFVRTRISSDPQFVTANDGGEDALSKDVAIDGEVEDYQLAVLAGAVCSYPTADLVLPLNGSVTDTSTSSPLHVPSSNNLGAGDFSSNIFASSPSAPFFDATKQFVLHDTGTTDFLNEAFNTMSLIFWLKPESFTGDQMIWDEGGSSQGAAIRLSGENLNAVVQDQEVLFNLSAAFPQDNQWHHVGLVYDADGGPASASIAQLYIDGVLVDNTTWTTPAPPLNTHGDGNGVGGPNGTTAFDANGIFYTGYLDELVYWNDATVTGTTGTGGVSGNANQAGDMATLAACHSPVAAEDYGDAPDSGAGTGANNYETQAANDGPRHLLDTDLFLGDVIGDTDADGSQTADALGDDSGDAPLAGNDEGVEQLLSSGTAFTPILNTDTSYQITVDATNNAAIAANLFAWIDFDVSGTFDDTELATVTGGTVPTGGATTVTLTWTVPTLSTLGDTFMRLRLTTSTLVDDLAAEDGRSRGYAGDGEVEDYQITIASVSDYGDAPANLGDASHVTSANLFLGAVQGDIDNGTQLGGDAGVGADGDDTDGNDDDDGIAVLTGLSNTDSSYQLSLTVNNSSGSPANVYAWLDFDRDGEFDQDERAVLQDGSIDVAGGDNILPDGSSGTVILEWPTTTNIGIGTSYLRVRITTDTIDNSTETTARDDASIGSSSDGEVEDYELQIADGSELFFEAECGVIGNVWHAFSDGTASQLVYLEQDAASNQTVTPGTEPLTNLQQHNLVVPVANTYNVWALVDIGPATADDDSFYIGDNNATWTEVNNLPDGGWVWSNTGFSFTTGSANEPKTIFITFRENGTQIDKFALIPTTGGTTPTGTGGPAATCLDFGDAPDPLLNTNGPGDYTTRLANTLPGPFHGVDTAPALFIGATVPDTETEAAQNVTASGDGSDEAETQLVTGGGSYPAIQVLDTAYSVTVDVTNTKIVDAVLMAWLDFNNNGVFEESERADTNPVVGASVGSVNRTLTWTSLPSLSEGDLFMRVRLSTDTDFTSADNGGEDALSLGVFMDGEIEDHRLTVIPASVCEYLTTDAVWSFEGNVSDSGTASPAHNGVATGLGFSIDNFVSGSQAAFLNGSASVKFDQAGTANFLREAFSSMTVGMWILPTDYHGIDTIWQEGDVTNGAAIRMNYDLNRIEARVADAGNQIDISVSDFAVDGQWHHVGLVYVGGLAFLYLDGVLANPGGTTGGHSAPVNTHNDQGGLGSNGDATVFGSGDGNFIGFIDELVYWTDAGSGGVGGTSDQRDNMAELASCDTPVLARDFGDAPDTAAGTAANNYETLAANNGPSHILGGGLFLGDVSADVDSDATPNVGALGDDTGDGALAGNDEGEEQLLTTASIITAIPNASSSYQIQIDVSNNSTSVANLYAWIDFDSSGTFDDSELAAVSGGTVPAVGPTSVLLTWSGLSTLTPSDTYLRIRLTTHDLVDGLGTEDGRSRGFAANGEVEDYAISIVAVDYGDAPDNGVAGNGPEDYTTLAPSGPSHSIDANIFLGTTVPDGDSDGFEEGVDNNGGATDDDNGGDEGLAQILSGASEFPALLLTDTSYGFSITAFNNTGSDAKVFAWIDFNRDGVFDEIELAGGSAVVVSSSASSQVVPLLWTSLPSVTAGVSYMRLRITTDSPTAANAGEDERSLGALSDGEVEDYAITLGNLDYGDAPAPYKTLSADNGPRHTISDDLYLGENVLTDLDSNGYVDGIDNNLNASDDDTEGDADENIDDLLTGASVFPTLFTSDISYTLSVNFNNQTGSAARIYAWIDFDQSGTFDVDEAIDGLFGQQGNSVTGDLTWPSIPNDIRDGITYARFRISSTPLIASGSGEDVRSLGFLANGEVEDHQITIDGVDFGDAPSSYLTFLANNGPRHVIGVGTLFIGSNPPDGDKDGFGNGVVDNADATDDDTEISADEGIGDLLTSLTSFPPLDAGDGSYLLTIDVSNTAGSDATIHGWIDFDNDGSFEEDERTSIAVVDGSNNAPVILNWTLPVGPGEVVVSATYARFRLRLNNDASTLPIGLATAGEVEDYQINISGDTTISGRVFEDINYGGGDGRNYATANASFSSTDVGTPATIELWASDGTTCTGTDPVATTVSDAGGVYSFSGAVVAAPADYCVRVVTNTVQSNRSGYTASAVAVPTFRAESTDGVGSISAIVDEVGGRFPALVDTSAGNNGFDVNQTSAWSIVSTDGSVISGVDFGFNFNAIVNTNDSGQGSLGQFMTNANLLSNADITQLGQTPLIDVSIFEIPTSDSNFNGSGQGEYTISPTALLPEVTDPIELNGETQAGASCPIPIIEVSGAAAPAGSGINISAGGSLVRGLVINNWSVAGISLSSGASNALECNYIGTNVAGSVAAVNTIGIDLSGSDNNTIGGTFAGQGNVISGNTTVGININADQNQVLRNVIGVAADGVSRLDNGGNGIAIVGSDNVVGNTSSNNANTIAYNGGDGVNVSGVSSLRNSIRVNVSYNNNGLGVNLQGAAGADAIDSDDADDGPNSLLNAPVLNAGTTISSNDLLIAATLELDDRATAIYTLELYANPVCNSGQTGTTLGDVAGEGFQFLGSFGITGTVEGENTFSNTLFGIASNLQGGVITAKLVEDGGDTSEFSNCITVATAQVIAGRVFEDVRYGGGFGRSFATANGVAADSAVGVPATVELWASDGTNCTGTAPLQAAATDGSSGNYSFSSAVLGAEYCVRVANTTVQSSRVGWVPGIVPIQTYGVNFVGAVVPETGLVGGESPRDVDAAPGVMDTSANDGVRTQSIAMIDGPAATGIDFGFNFSSVVNVNSSGQGSLSQFILNANSLTPFTGVQDGSRLSVAGGTESFAAAVSSGTEASIFMVSNGVGSEDGLANNAQNLLGGSDVAEISLSATETISRSNISIDGTTQTINVTGNDNGAYNSGATVGRLATVQGQIRLPDVQLSGGGINVAALNTQIRGIAFLPTTTALNITANSAIIEQNGFGVSAVSFSEPGSGSSADLVVINTADEGMLRNNAFGFGDQNGVQFGNGAAVWAIEDNLFQGFTQAGFSSVGQFACASFERNQFTANSNGVNFAGSNVSSSCSLQNSTFNLNTTNGINIDLPATPVVDIVNNLITENGGGGIGLSNSSTNILISQNHIFNNTGLGIDLENDNVVTTGEGGGANGNLNIPVINAITADGDNVTVNVTASSGQSGLQLELYSSAVCNGDAVGLSQALQFGEGEKLHIPLTPRSDAASGVAFDINVDINTDPLAGDFFTATLRDGNDNTSEFSACAFGLFNDYGDAPASYGTSLAANGARHRTSSAIFIATPPDAEIDGLISVSATGDDAAGIDDEDNLTFDTLTNTKTSYTVTVNNVFNNTGSDAQLTAWIDFDGNGSFDTDEAATVTVSSSASTTRDFDIEWVASPSGGQGSIPIDIAAGTSFARIRLSTDTSVLTTDPSTSSPLGLATNGEVEDYQLIITQGADYGDAPDSYSTTAANSGALHFQGGTVYLGFVQPDGDDDGIPSVGADGDDADNGDDEDGTLIGAGLSPGDTVFQVDVVVSNFSGSTVNLYGWLDTNIDGNFGSGAGADTGEFTSVLSIASGSSSTQTLTWSGFSVPGVAGTATTYLRLRVTSDTLPIDGSGFFGAASDGEVEDYKLVVSELTCDTIYGTYYDGGLNVGDSDEIRIYDPSAGSAALSDIIFTQSVSSNGTALDPITRRYYYYDKNGDTSIFYYDGSSEIDTGAQITAGNSNQNRSAFDANGDLWFIETNLSDGGPLVKFSVNGTGLTPEGLADNTIANNPANAVSVLTTVGGDMIFDVDNNMYLLTYDGGANNYYIFRVDDLATNPTATLLFNQPTPAAGQQVAGAAFWTDDFVYLGSTAGKVFRWDLGQDIITPVFDASFGGTDYGVTDMGSCIFPTLRPAVTATKRVFNETNPSDPGFSPGDILRYEIIFRNSGAVLSSNTAFTDAIPSNTSYIANTTTLNGASLADNGVAMPFAGVPPAIGNINSPGQTAGQLLNDSTPNNINDNEAVVTFKVQVDTLTGFIEVCNQGSVEVVDVSQTSTTAGATITVLTDDPATGAANDPTCLDKFSGYGIFGSVYEDLDLDQVFNGAESGISGVTVVLRDNTAGTCTATTTAGDGSYQFLPLALGSYTVYEAVGESLGSPSCPPTEADPNGFVSSSSNNINVTIINDDVIGQDFGDVQPPLFTPNNAGIVQPGESIVYSHTLTPRTDGNVSFSVAENTIPLLAGWSVTMNNDLNCNGVLENGEPSINGAIAATAGVDLCILVRVTAPTGASAANQHIATVTANFDYPGSFVSNTLLDVIDTTTVVSADDGALLLIKTVQNLDGDGANAAELILNEGLPGDELLYRVKFQNVGNAPITNIDIFDTTPAFTELSLTIPANCVDARGALATIPVQIPASFTSCTVTVDGGSAIGNNVGYTGSLQWTLLGPLAPGEQGFVVFTVTIN